MATFIKQFTFVAATNILPNEVNANFDDIATFLNNQVVHVDGSRAMTGGLTLPGSDPTSDNQAARKAYVDAQITTTNSNKAKALASHGSIQQTPPTLPNWASTALLIQGGRVDATTNGAGDITLTFPTAFPNGLLAVTANSLIAARNYYLTVHDTGTKAAVGIRVYQQDGTPLVSTATTLVYIAIGW